MNNNTIFLNYDTDNPCECNREQATNVMMSIEEYNGLQNALRIVKDRSLQQLNKSQRNENGYRLLRADQKYYGRSESKAWLVTKESPFSASIDLPTVKVLLLNDLQKYANYVEIKYVDGQNRNVTLKPDEVLKYYSIYVQKKDENDPTWRSAKGVAVYEVFSKFDGKITFELAKISINYSSGLYEMSYWATNLI